MRLLVTGSREWPPTKKGLGVIFHYLRLFMDDTTKPTLIEGESPDGGVDAFAAAFGKAMGWRVLPVPAEVSEGRTRPLPWQFAQRNQKMVDMAPDYVLGFFVKGAGNRGTRMTVDMAHKAGIPVKEVWYDPISESVTH